MLSFGYKYLGSQAEIADIWNANYYTVLWNHYFHVFSGKISAEVFLNWGMDMPRLALM
jgi:hypothetical protein